MIKEDIPVFIKWIDFSKWLLATTDKFPKKVRFTFSNRINNLALEVIENLIEARYTRNKTMLLNQANLKIEKIRILLRICYELRLLPEKAYKHAMYAINEVGKMIGGWIKYQKGQQA